ncbi:hypothetical protein, partial [[Eubacterium] cellulosolvens]
RQCSHRLAIQPQPFLLVSLEDASFGRRVNFIRTSTGVLALITERGRVAQLLENPFRQALSCAAREKRTAGTRALQLTQGDDQG